MQSITQILSKPTAELIPIVQAPACMWFTPQEFTVLLELLRRLEHAERATHAAQKGPTT